MKLRTNIEKLKVLTEALIDRDYVKSKALDLFDTFCNDFPIPMNAWIADSDLCLIEKKGTLVQDENEKVNIGNIFDGDVKDKNVDMHKRALKGDVVTYTIAWNDKIFLTRLIPASSSGGLVFGISMDITSFVHMSNALDYHCKDMENNGCKLLKKVKNDDLYKIIKEEG